MTKNNTIMTAWIEIATKMYGGELPNDLFSELAEVAEFIAKVKNYDSENPELLSREVIATIIVQWKRRPYVRQNK